MANILFIGVGTMGYPMATNLIKNKHSLNFYDPYALEKNIKNLKSLGCIKIESLKNIPNNSSFYIVHSYIVKPANKKHSIGVTEYGNDIYTSIINNVSILKNMKYITKNVYCE